MVAHHEDGVAAARSDVDAALVAPVEPQCDVTGETIPCSVGLVRTPKGGWGAPLFMWASASSLEFRGDVWVAVYACTDMKHAAARRNIAH